MGRTRFMVVKAKELIKTAVFAVLGVIILVVFLNPLLLASYHDFKSASFQIRLDPVHVLV